MEDRYENKLTSYEGTITLFNDNAEKVATYPALALSVADLKGKVEVIKQKSAKFSSASKGIADLKAFFEKELIDILYPCTVALFLTTKTSGNAEIKGYCNFSRRDLEKSRDTVLAEIGRKAHGWAVSEATLMTEQKWPPEKSVLLEGRLLDYENIIGKREKANEVRKTALQEMKDEFTGVDVLFDEEIDKQMELMKEEFPTFYSEYKGTREIKNIGIRHEPEPTPPAS